MNSTAFTITLPEAEWVQLPQTHFCQAIDGATMEQQTLIKLRQADGLLTIAFACKDDQYWQQTTYTEHNSDLWNQAVFEVFIAAGTDIPTRYLEIEINPNNALFVGWVDNPTGEGDANQLTMVPYEKAGIKHQIRHTTPNSWEGELSIPLTLINPTADSLATSYRLNFYRIIQTIPQTDPAWVCSPANASFQCLSSTRSGTPPRFHIPASFGTLLMK